MRQGSNPIARPNASAAARGFTLLELLISLFVLSIVAGAVFEQINQMQRKSSSEAMKLDLNQEAREFLDQTVRDLHVSGYPGKSMYSNPDLTKVAAGVVSVSPTQILFEGDVNNDGNVYSVKIQYIASDPGDPNCPCIRRWATVKSSADSLNQPSTNAAYTETEHVFPPGTGDGQSGEDLFAYYDQNGNPIDVSGGVDISIPAGPSTSSGSDTMATIKTVKINLSLLTTLRDPATNGLIRTSMSATARLNQ